MENADKTGYVLDGELLVTGNGVYTFAYTYRAPIDDAQVLLISMNHWGDEDYFERVGEILREAEVVVFEGVRGESWGDYSSIWDKLDELGKDKLDLETSEFYSLASKFQRRVIKAAELKLEQAALPESESWISGDEAFWHSLTKDDGALARYSGSLLAAAKRVPPELISSFSAFLKMKSRLISAQNLRRAYGEYLLLTCDTPDLYVSLTIEYVRETLAVETLERELVTRKPGKIALKFGVSHISRIRRTLESLGYKLLKTERLLNIKFSD